MPYFCNNCKKTHETGEICNEPIEKIVVFSDKEILAIIKILQYCKKLFFVKKTVGKEVISNIILILKKRLKFCIGN
jgi:hypothetical protein